METMDNAEHCGTIQATSCVHGLANKGIFKWYEFFIV